jgi:glyoxalase family protein
MPHHIPHLHHVTATTDDAHADLGFYRALLGLRLVKKTVNFDNHDVYHFYYGNETGTPGTIMTTFPYRGQGVRTGSKGSGQVTSTAFAVPPGSQAYWLARLTKAQVSAEPVPDRWGEWVLAFEDPSGLRIELVGTEDDRPPWTGGEVPEAMAIRGLHGVTATLALAGPTQRLLEETLGFRQVSQADQRLRFQTGAGGSGHHIDLLIDPAQPKGRNGMGTVHHVALAIATDEEQLALRADLLDRGIQVTEVRDRHYFRSIYFREPGGILFEVATIPPGFDVDEPLAQLGQALKLPKWEEPNRPEIEGKLPLIGG